MVELIITSDVGVQVASSLTEELRYEARLENAKKPAALRQLIIEKLVDIYEKMAALMKNQFPKWTDCHALCRGQRVVKHLYR